MVKGKKTFVIQRLNGIFMHFHKQEGFALYIGSKGNKYSN